MLEARVTKQLRDYTLDLAVRAGNGEVVVLMGQNGAGKSTTLNLIAGLLAPDAGTIYLNGSPVFDSSCSIDLPVEERRIGYVFQKSAVFPHMTVAENIAFGLVAHRVERAMIGPRVRHWLDTLGIADIAGIRAAHLSGGQKQRVALARALAIRPALLMFDEPFSMLDTRSSDAVRDLIRAQVRELDIPCLLVSHRVMDAHELGDRICLLNQGKNYWEGTPAEFTREISGCRCGNGLETPC